MGASASMMEIEGNPELTGKIKQDYENLKNEGKDDDDIKNVLTERYSPIKEKPVLSPQKSEKLPPKPEKVLTKNVSEKVISEKANTSTKVPVVAAKKDSKTRGRRQSFAPEQLGKLIKSPIKDPSSVVESESCSQLLVTPVVESPQKDSWDSVMDQPSCLICQMTFPSETKLERHVKYSDMHAKALKKLEDLKNKPAEEQAPIDISPERMLKKQIEGEHYKLLYSGTKFFWRTKDTIDIHLYLHILSNCIEVIPFDVDRHKEMNRSYLEHYILLSLIEKEARDTVEKRKDELKAKRMKNNRNNEVLPPDEIMMEEAKRVIIVSHILDRLQIMAAVTDFGPQTLVYAPISLSCTESSANELNGAKNVEKPALLLGPPPLLIPVSIARRRRSNAEDVKSALNNLDLDRMELRKATGNAERITNLLFMSTSSLQDIAKRKAALRNANFSKAKMRWMNAVRRVIIQNSVKRFTKMIEEYEQKLKVKLLGNTSADNRARRVSTMKKAHEI